MSTYQLMWNAIKKLNVVETDWWLLAIGPPTGRSIQFYGISVLDVDLVEALKYWYKDFFGNVGEIC